jgi:phage-related protein
MTTWSFSTLNDTVTQELEKLPADVRARFTKVSDLIERFGPQKVGMPHTRSLGDKLWEIRASGKDGISRGI